MWLLIVLVSAILFLNLALFLFPMISALFFKKKSRLGENIKKTRTLDIIIPCHNDAAHLALTLQSIGTSMGELCRCFEGVNVQTVCGLDSCTDESAQEASKFPVTLRRFEFKSKWRVLNQLIQESNADWIALADCGVVWKKNLLRNAYPYFCDQEIVGIAPSYKLLKENTLNRVHWTLEKILKSLENRSGGPVSVHGATVFYRSHSLKKALRLLEGRHWTNDDVILPTIVRAIHPNQRIVYCTNLHMGFSVEDNAPRINHKERQARMRVSHGNVQWLNHILPFVWRWNKALFITCLRRVFRIFWIAPVLAVCFAMILLSLRIANVTQQTALIYSIAGTLILAIASRKVSSANASISALKRFILRPRTGEELIKWS